MFNARWFVKPLTFGNTGLAQAMLVFEPKTKITTTTWLAISDVEKTEGVCFSWSEEDLKAFGDFQYSKDYVDQVGIDIIDRYNDVVEWNNPVSQEQRGGLRINLPFAPADFDIYSTGSGKQKNFKSYLRLHLQNSITSIPKLLLWDGESRDRATIKISDDLKTG